MSDCLVIHLSGVDRPGVTASLTKIIAEEGAQLITIGQSVLYGYLNLSAVIQPAVDSSVLRRLLFASADLGYRFEAMPLTEDKAEPKDVGVCVTIFGNLSDGQAISVISAFLANNGLNVRSIRTLSDESLVGIELIADPLIDVNFSQLKSDVLKLAGELCVDVAVQRDDAFKNTKRLVCLDVDSTFVQGEFIDELAQLAGCHDQVAQLTERTMRGELDFSQSLRERVRLFAGLKMSEALDLIDKMPLSHGALEFAGLLKAYGFKVGLVSGGFDFFVNELKGRFGLDFSFANELEVIDGKITGEVLGTIVNAQRKAQILKDMCQAFGCCQEQTVAIGDGANDIPMLQAAGLGIAFHAKPELQRVADASFNVSQRMDVLRFLMGLPT